MIDGLLVQIGSGATAESVFLADETQIRGTLETAFTSFVLFRVNRNFNRFSLQSRPFDFLVFRTAGPHFSFSSSDKAAYPYELTKA